MCRVLNRAIWFISADRADAQEESFAVINAISPVKSCSEGEPLSRAKGPVDSS